MSQNTDQNETNRRRRNQQKKLTMKLWSHTIYQNAVWHNAVVEWHHDKKNWRENGEKKNTHRQHTPNTRDKYTERETESRKEEKIFLVKIGTMISTIETREMTKMPPLEFFSLYYIEREYDFWITHT